MARASDGGKADRWRELLAEKESTAESVAEFCSRRGVPVHQFYWWRRQLSGSTRPRAAELAASSAHFVPVRVTVSAPMIEVIHPGGCIVRVAAGVDAWALRSVLEALRAVEV